MEIKKELLQDIKTLRNDIEKIKEPVCDEYGKYNVLVCSCVGMAEILRDTLDRLINRTNNISFRNYLKILNNITRKLPNINVDVELPEFEKLIEKYETYLRETANYNMEK